jgi:prephenate dehydrogenase
VSTHNIQQLTIFGVGLIGGSLAKALRKVGYCHKIVGCSRHETHLQRAVELDVIDDYFLDPIEAVKNANIILLAVPLGAMETILAKIKNAIPTNCIITDAGSAKESVIHAVERVFPEGCPNFVAGHPIAGREQSGVDAAISDLYQGRRTILTPLASTDHNALRTIQTMWQAAGAQVEIMPVQQHDQVLAATSHLPHLLAYNLVNTLAKSEHSEDIFRYAAGGFKDFTRIASSDPTMWRDICMANRSAILEMINHYQDSLGELAQLIESDNTDAVFDIFSEAKASREQFLKIFKQV